MKYSFATFPGESGGGGGSSCGTTGDLLYRLADDLRLDEIGDRGGVRPPGPCKELMDVFFFKFVALELVDASDCVEGERRKVANAVRWLSSRVLVHGFDLSGELLFTERLLSGSGSDAEEACCGGEREVEGWGSVSDSAVSFSSRRSRLRPGSNCWAMGMNYRFMNKRC